jgi:hypothetical protein
MEQQVLGECRPSGWVLLKLSVGRGPDRGVIHAVDCEEAPAEAPALTLDKALDAAERQAPGCVQAGRPIRPCRPE